MNQRPRIKASVPVFGDGSVEQGIIEKLAPIFNNVAREIGMLNQRLSRLEAIGPGVQITFSPKDIQELEQAIKAISFKMEDEWTDEGAKEAKKDDKKTDAPEGN